MVNRASVRQQIMKPGLKRGGKITYKMTGGQVVDASYE